MTWRRINHNGLIRIGKNKIQVYWENNIKPTEFYFYSVQSLDTNYLFDFVIEEIDVTGDIIQNFIFLECNIEYQPEDRKATDTIAFEEVIDKYPWGYKVIIPKVENLIVKF